VGQSQIRERERRKRRQSRRAGMDQCDRRGQIGSAIKRYATEPGDQARAEGSENGKARRLERREPDPQNFLCEFDGLGRRPVAGPNPEDCENEDARAGNDAGGGQSKSPRHCENRDHGSAAQHPVEIECAGHRAAEQSGDRQPPEGESAKCRDQVEFCFVFRGGDALIKHEDEACQRCLDDDVNVIRAGRLRSIKAEHQTPEDRACGAREREP